MKPIKSTKSWYAAQTEVHQQNALAVKIIKSQDS